MYNPFAELTDFLTPAFMQVYIIVMVIAVAVATILDMFHKGSYQWFKERREDAERRAKRQVSGGERFSLMLKTLGKEVLTSGEFCNVQRRISHLFMFYGFILYILSTVVMVYGYSTAPSTPGLWPFLWYLGAVMILFGAGWFFFFIRVNVSHEQDSPFAIIPADLFVLSLMASALFAIIWGIAQQTGSLLASQILFWIYIVATTVLFGGVYWSKFAHMFYKPTAAYQKKVEEASQTLYLPKAAYGHKQVAAPGRTRS